MASNARNTFIALYEAHFGEFPAKGKPDVAELWWRIVDSVPEKAFERLLELIREERRGLTRPLLGEVERASRRLLAEQREHDETAQALAEAEGPPGEPCCYCEDTGWSFYLAVRSAERWRCTVRTDLGRLQSFMVPCWCSKGEDVVIKDKTRKQSIARRYQDELLAPEAERRDKTRTSTANALRRESARHELEKAAEIVSERPRVRDEPPDPYDETSEPSERTQDVSEHETPVIKTPPPPVDDLPF